MEGLTGLDGRGGTRYGPTGRSVQSQEVPLSTPPQPPRPASEGAGPSSRDKILDTAESLFARRGFEGVGLREVARLSELSKSALFHHFPTKVDLYAAVLERILGQLLEAIGHLPPNEGALDRLVAVVDAMIDGLADSPTRAPLLLRSLFEGEVLDGHETPAADELLTRLLRTASDAMRDGVASGELREISVPHAMQAVIGMLVFHFASGDFGDEVLGRPVYSATEIRRFKQFVASFIANGLANASPPSR